MAELDQHLRAAAARIDARHACPECPIGTPRPFCPVCLGDGSISTDRLDRYSAAADLR